MSNVLKSRAELERLNKLIEECSEVIKVACKIISYGYDDCHPEKAATNRERLEEELGDVEYWIDRMTEQGDIDPENIRETALSSYKHEKVLDNTKYQPGSRWQKQ